MASYKKAIEAKCKDCIYDPLVSGSWRKQVEECNSWDCPLWDVRPVTVNTTHTKRQKNKDDG